MARRFTLLPGLHGTAGLFEDFQRFAPSAFETTALSYPAGVCSYPDAVAHVTEALSDAAPSVIIAESFSTPVAVSVAASMPDRAQGLVLAAGFVRAPGPSWARLLPLRVGFVVGRPFAGAFGSVFGSRTLARQVRAELEQVPAGTLAARLRAVLAVDVQDQLSQVSAPMLYLRGTRDVVVRSRCLRDIESNARFLTVREVSSTHFILQNRPAEAWECIEQFCCQCDSA